MTGDDRRQGMDPKLLERIRARLARIRTHQAAQRTQELSDRMAQLPPNWIEARLLDASKRKEQQP